ncbi:MAG: YggS family pyridoxal phosphate-dependent enzyme [Deltaproteobacteria bacterium]|nr:YggS family pyridoxal phosphate-dependent enzyme [Deltaproteobacteria bacterium]
MNIFENLTQVRDKIAKSASLCNRNPDTIKLIVVSKTQPLVKVFAAYEAGVRDFGENTAQGLQEKAQAFAERGLSARWHFIGRLQTNKINIVLRYAHMIHSVDSIELAQAIAKRVTSQTAKILIQVNIGKEAQKGGVEPEQAVQLALNVSRINGLELVGLMGIPPYNVDPNPYFAHMSDLKKALISTPDGIKAIELSMGMTSDFTAAIQHGATMVRVGTAIFGERT